MKRCIDCKKIGVSCNKHSSMTINAYCKNADWKKPTNYERIKNMSVEEMAKWLLSLTDETCGICAEKVSICNGSGCVEGIKKWLESEVTDNGKIY